MSIRREDLDAGRVDLSEAVDADASPVGLIYPGLILKEEFLIPLGMSASALATALRLPRTRINDIVLGRRAITADTALRLARYFGTTAQFWVNLQTGYDLKKTAAEVGQQIEQDVSPRAA